MSGPRKRPIPEVGQVIWLPSNSAEGWQGELGIVEGVDRRPSAARKRTIVVRVPYHRSAPLSHVYVGPGLREVDVRQLPKYDVSLSSVFRNTPWRISYHGRAVDGRRVKSLVTALNGLDCEIAKRGIDAVTKYWAPADPAKRFS